MDIKKKLSMNPTQVGRHIIQENSFPKKLGLKLFIASLNFTNMEPKMIIFEIPYDTKINNNKFIL